MWNHQGHHRDDLSTTRCHLRQEQHLQVPPGQPPLDPTNLPELPPWQFDPFAVDEHVDGGTGFDGLEDFWTPADQQPRPQQHRHQPGADRLAWLENDVRMRRGERPILTVSTGSDRCTDMVVGYIPQPPPQPPQGPGIGPCGVPVYAAPMQYGPVPLQWQQSQPQAKGPDGEASEVLRNVPITLPTLRAGDWLSELMPLISDVSEGARVWWTGLVQRAQDAYTQWLTAGPMDRMAVQFNLTFRWRTSTSGWSLECCQCCWLQCHRQSRKKQSL